MTTNANTPVPKALTALLACPWRFGFFEAVSLLDCHWLNTDELAAGLSKKLLLTPCQALGFPAAEVTLCDLDVRHQLVRLESGLLGLYGINAPLPHYFLEWAASDQPGGERFRAFLDIFNHLLYCLLYQSWQKTQLSRKGRGAVQFDQLLNHLLGHGRPRIASCGLVALNLQSAASLCQLLRKELRIGPLFVDDWQSEWQPLEPATRLGETGLSILGERTVLGERVLVSGKGIVIRIGPICATQAKELSPGGKQAELMVSLLTLCLPAAQPWCCQLHIEGADNEQMRLGTGLLVLGDNSFIGEKHPSGECRCFRHWHYPPPVEGGEQCP